MMDYEGLSWSREDYLTPPLPDGPYRLLLTPRSFFFLSDNLRRLLGFPAHFKPHLPPLEFLPVAGTAARFATWLSEVNLQLSQFPQAPQIVASEELTDIFQRYEAQENLLPPDHPHPLRMLGIMLNQALIGPTTMHLDLHNGCNAKCVYCWFHSPTSDKRFSAEWKKDMMTEETFYPLMDELASLGGKEDLLFSGKGEPLLHPLIFEYLAYAKKLGFSVTLFTNGIRLDEKVISRLLELEVDRLYISLSSASDESYPLINPAGSAQTFQKIRAQLCDLSRQKKEAGKTCLQVYLVSVLNRHNVHEMPRFAALARELSFEYVRFQLLHVQDYNQHLKLSAQDFNQIRLHLKQISEDLKDSSTAIVHNIFTQMAAVDEDSGNWLGNELPGKGCSVGYDFSRVWSNGDVSFCCSPKVMGNVKGGGFKSLWQSDLYQSLRTAAMHLAPDTKKLFPNGTTLLGEHCNGCPNYEGVTFVTSATAKVFGSAYPYNSSTVTTTGSKDEKPA